MTSYQPRLTLVAIALFFAACSGSAPHVKTTTDHGTNKPTYQRVSDLNTSGQEDHTNSPAASLVKNGIEKLKMELFDEAQWQFEQAVSIDPGFGPAYYWLARVRSKFNELTQAMDLLDKAASLLKDSATWLQRIEDFRQWVVEQSSGH